MNKSTNDSQYVNSVFNRLKSRYNLRNDSDLARFLGVNASTLAMHRKRGRLDYDKVISVCGDADLNWVFRGQAVAEGVVAYTDEPAASDAVKSELLDRLDEIRRVVERL